MGFLDRLFGKPNVATFAAVMIHAFREGGNISDLRFDAAENCIARSDPDAPWIVNLDKVSRRGLCTRGQRLIDLMRIVAGSFRSLNRSQSADILKVAR
jgi:hypothetical protein